MCNNQPKKHSAFQILISKDSRGKRLLDDFNAWQAGEPPNVFISLLLGMTDPTNPDTDDDGMYDGFEYWFTSWDLNENRWGLNPLIETDVNLDSDGDSYDCNQDGTIDLDERFSNFGNGNREPGASISIEVQFQLLWESLILARMR